MDKNEINKYMNRQAGNFTLALFILIGYIGLKIARVGFSFALALGIFFITGILIYSLIADLFENNEVWIYDALREIESSNLSPEDKINMIKQKLNIAVERHIILFIKINGFDSFIDLIKTHAKRIVKGIITVKELIVILIYIVYDLIIRGGALDVIYPYDGGVAFILFILLNVLTSTKGFAGLVANLYHESFSEKDNKDKLKAIEELIKQLGGIFNIQYNKCDETTKEKIKIEIAEKNTQ